MGVACWHIKRDNGMDLTLRFNAFGGDFPRELRMGTPPYPWTAALCGGFDTHERVRLVTLERRELVEGLCNETLACALIPPADAVSVPRHRAIPGIGICTPDPCPAGTFWPDDEDMGHFAGLPQVHAIWVAGPGTPAPLLRVLLTAALQTGEALPPPPGLPASVYHRVGSLEMEFIRLETARIHGPGHEPVTWC
jgi:hypothetical protein